MDSNSKNVTNDFSEYSEMCIIGNEYYENFLNLLNKSENDYPEDIEISIYDNLKSNNNARESSLSIINEIINEFVNDDESKKGFITLLKQSFLIGKLRSNIENEYIIGVFGKKKSGKSTFIEKIFKGCKTNHSYDNSTIGLNLYYSENNKNLSFIDSPGDTEKEGKLGEFSIKGYEFSKMIIYVISEIETLDARDMRNNENLKMILRLKMKYKLPMIILLTHSDDFCNKIKQTNKNWKDICKKQINNNKANLLEWANEYIKQEINENDIFHVVLVEKETVEIKDEDVINSFDQEEIDDYNKEDEEGKKRMLKMLKRRMEKEILKENEVLNFIRNEIKVLGQKELIEEMKKHLPSQYHNGLLLIK